MNRNHEAEAINSINMHFKSATASGSGTAVVGFGSNTQISQDRARSLYLKAQSTGGHGEISLFLRQIIDVIKGGSYVLTLIIMMTWSITYHSWLGLVFLVSSCFIWMTPDSRKACLNCSPFIVFYALLLLAGQYVYSLNLTEEELPSTIDFISVSEIGFRKYFEYSYQSLFIKIFYTFFFWITLRQKSEKKSAIPVEATQQYPAFFPGTNPATSANARQSNVFNQSDFGLRNNKSQYYEAMVVFLQGCLIKYWIWVVAAMLMVMSISGQRVVVYRIFYMALFLTFTIVLMVSIFFFSFSLAFFFTFLLLAIVHILAPIHVSILAVGNSLLNDCFIGNLHVSIP